MLFILYITTWWAIHFLVLYFLSLEYISSTFSLLLRDIYSSPRLEDCPTLRRFSIKCYGINSSFLFHVWSTDQWLWVKRKINYGQHTISTRSKHCILDQQFSECGRWTGSLSISSEPVRTKAATEVTLGERGSQAALLTNVQTPQRHVFTQWYNLEIFSDDRTW